MFDVGGDGPSGRDSGVPGKATGLVEGNYLVGFRARLGYIRPPRLPVPVEASEDVTVISTEAALLTGSGTSTVTLEDGRSFENRFAVSLVFVRKGDGWKVLHGHYSAPNPR